VPEPNFELPDASNRSSRLLQVPGVYVKGILMTVALVGRIWFVFTGPAALVARLLALAAQDLLGTVKGWDRDAYDLLTRAWRGAFPRPLHPQDAAAAAA
jgi:hypothetical protein